MRISHCGIENESQPDHDDQAAGGDGQSGGGVAWQNLPAAPRPDRNRNARRDEAFTRSNAAVSGRGDVPLAMPYGQVSQDQVALAGSQPV